MATNMKKKKISSTVGGWFKELKDKEFGIFYYKELLFFNGLFQNSYFKKLILQKTRLKYRCLK